MLPAVYRIAPELVLFQMTLRRPPIGRSSPWRISVPPSRLPKAIKDLADEVSPWNERSLIDALRRQARHQESTRWDTIEFKLD